MNRLLCIAPLLLLSGGCSSTNINELAKTVAGDPAIISAQIASVYGTVKFSRVGSVTNCLVTVSPDGTISVDGRSDGLHVTGTTTATVQQPVLQLGK